MRLKGSFDSQNLESTTHREVQDSPQAYDALLKRKASHSLQKKNQKNFVEYEASTPYKPADLLLHLRTEHNGGLYEV